MLLPLIALGVIVAILFYVVFAGVKIVRPYEKGIVEQLGKYQATVDPGLRIIIPFIQTIRLVDMREQVVDVPPQEVITQDNVAVTVDAVIYYEPTDPQRLVYNIANFILAITKLAQTNLRNVIGEMTLDQALVSRDTVNNALRVILDDATDKWGVRVVRVEIQKIDPPADVMNAMHEQMKAERTRRAVVTEASGAREAAVTRAEGDKTSNILLAEGRKQSAILDAEGEAEAVRARAEAEQYRQQVVAAGEADAIDSVYNAIMDTQPTQELLALKYLEALEGIADGRATKIFLPSEMSGILGSLGGVAELFGDDSPTPTSDEHRPERPQKPKPAARPRPSTPSVSATSAAPPSASTMAPPASMTQADAQASADIERARAAARARAEQLANDMGPGPLPPPPRQG